MTTTEYMIFKNLTDEQATFMAGLAVFFILICLCALALSKVKYGSPFKVRYVHWYNLPVPMYRHEGEDRVRVGYVWCGKAYMIKNINHGWVAMVEWQTPENLNHPACPYCKSILPSRFKETK